MLTKSLRSAVILSAIGVLAFTFTSAILNLAIPALLGNEPAVFLTPPPNANPTEVLAIVVLLFGLILLIAITIGAYWIYRFFGEAYFGQRGAVRWALFGIFAALLFKLPDWISLPGGWLVENLVLLVGVFLAFFGARALVPLRRK